MTEKIRDIYAEYDTTLIQVRGFIIRAQEEFDGNLELTLAKTLKEAELTNDPAYVRWAHGSYRYWLDHKKKKRK